MKLITIALVTSALAFAGWGDSETTEYRFFTQKRDLSKLANIGLPVPPNGGPSVAVFVTAKEGTPAAKEHRVSIRFVGMDGKTYRQTLTALPNPAGGFYAVFDVAALDVLSVSAERVDPPIIQEAQ